MYEVSHTPHCYDRLGQASTSKLYTNNKSLHHFGNPNIAEAFARIECHYFINEGFFEYDGWILDQIDKIRYISTEIVQGRYDVVSPMNTAWELHKKWPEADFHVIPDSGHSMLEEGIRNKFNPNSFLLKHILAQFKNPGTEPQYLSLIHI